MNVDGVFQRKLNRVEQMDKLGRVEMTQMQNVPHITVRNKERL